MRARRRDTNEKKIIKVFERTGAMVVRINDDRVKGIPDLLVGYKGYNLLVEVKTEKGTLSPEQLEFISEWPGGRPFVARSVEEAQEIIDRLRLRRRGVTTNV